jgi:hypothetical protein
MKILSTFVCNLRQDSFHAVGDQCSYWSMRMMYSLADVNISFSSVEGFLFYHGWLILLVWRCFNASLDTYKRVRDVSKPEWETQIKPLILKDAIRQRRLSLWNRFLKFIKSIL